jgi:hypothetical protein
MGIRSRPAFPRPQRYTTVLWSGDIGGNWESFWRQIPAGFQVRHAGLIYGRHFKRSICSKNNILDWMATARLLDSLD